MMFIALAVDFGRQNGYLTTLQAAADQTALALTRTLTSNSSANSLTPTATSMLSINSSTNYPITLTSLELANNNAQLCVSARQQVPTILSKWFLPSTPTVGVTSCAATQGSGTFEIALVMDNTGSMANSTNGKSKLSFAQQAAKALITQLNPSGQTALASFSVVPFSTSVNVGTTYANASWLDTSAQSSTHWQNYTRPSGAPWNPTSRFDLLTQMGATWKGCVEERPDPYMVTDTPASSSNPDSLFVPYLWPDEGDVPSSSPAVAILPGKDFGTKKSPKIYGSSNWDINGSNTLNNYLYDYGGSCTASNDVYEQADVADPISQGTGWTKVCKYKGVSGVSSSTSGSGPNKNCISNSLVTLTQDTSALNTKIDSMVASGDTNILAGMMWGWRTISPNGPFSSASIVPKAYGTAGNTKVIVFLTDGMNTWQSQNSNYKSEYNALGYYKNNRLSAYGGTSYPAPDGSVNSNGSTTSGNFRQQMDAAVLAACTNAKAAGVVIYTVGFNIPSDPIDTQGLNLLAKCATDSGHSFVATDGNALLNAFAQIGTGIGKLRLVQ